MNVFTKIKSKIKNALQFKPDNSISTTPSIHIQLLKNYKKRTINPIGIIIHYISAIYIKPNNPYHLQSIIDIFNHYKVSADYLIDREGKIYQLIPDNCYSFHAGVSQLPSGECVYTNSGKPVVNSLTIGIELMGTASSGFTDEQYEALTSLTKYLIHKYPSIKKQNILGHEDVALPAGRKQDPGKLFNWEKYKSSLQ